MNKRPTLTMKALITLIFILLIGAVALAQNHGSHESKVQHCKVGLLLDRSAVRTVACEELSQIDDLARLYKRSNTRIRKALNFKTKYKKAKLA